MDLNHLYHREQVELMRADAAACQAARSSHQGLARAYGAEIARRKASNRPRASARG